MRKCIYNLKYGVSDELINLGHTICCRKLYEEIRFSILKFFCNGCDALNVPTIIIW